MKTIRSMISGAVLVAASATAVMAADLNGGGGSMKDGYMPMPTAASRAAWYVRGDVGYASFDDTSMLEAGRFDLFATDIESSWSVGGGIGRYFSKNIRGDLTWDHRFESDVTGRTGSGSGSALAGGTRHFGMTSDVFLANVYYDLDNTSRVTPYIGIGLGGAYNRTTSGTVSDPCGCTGLIAGGNKWNMAAALMSGASFTVTDRLRLDAGYRFLYQGDAQTGAVTGTGAAAGTSSSEIAMRDIWSHEFRLGVRYDIR